MRAEESNKDANYLILNDNNKNIKMIKKKLNYLEGNLLIYKVYNSISLIFYGGNRRDIFFSFWKIKKSLLKIIIML